MTTRRSVSPDRDARRRRGDPPHGSGLGRRSTRVRRTRRGRPARDHRLARPLGRPARRRTPGRASVAAPAARRRLVRPRSRACATWTRPACSVRCSRGSAPPTTASCRPTTRGRSGARRTTTSPRRSRNIRRASPGLATLPTANVAWAAEELERAHTELGLIGAVLPLDAFVTLAGARALAPIFAVSAEASQPHLRAPRRGRARHPGTVALESGATQPVASGSPPPGAPPRRRRATTCRRARSSSRRRISRPASITLALTDFLDAYPDVSVRSR